MPVAGWFLFAAAFVTSALGGALGMASGIFIVPVLVLFAGIGLHAAVAASLVSVIACSCASAAPFLRAGLTNIRLALVLETATTSGALCGVWLAGVVPVRGLYALFTAILLLSAWQMAAGRTPRARAAVAGGAEAAGRRGWADALSLHGAYPAAAHGASGGPSGGLSDGASVPYRITRLPAGLVLMYGAGLVSALLGIGSGVLKIPAMDTALRLPIKVSSATSSFMIGVTAAASAVAYFLRGDIDPGLAGPVALGSVLGALAGARLLLVVSPGALRRLFIVVLVALAGQMLLAAFGVRLGGA